MASQRGGKRKPMEVTIREARASDKEPLMEFIKDVWGGTDYIPRVWDGWLADKSAVMLVVLVDGRPVGMNRMKFTPDGSAWLEGVRIHPDYRGRGLASMLGERSIEIGSKRGVSVFRLTSYNRNWSAHRQVAKMGFKEVSRLSVYEASKGSRFRPQPSVRKAEPEDVPAMMKSVLSSRDYKRGGGLYWDGYSAAKLELRLLEGLVESGSVYVKGGGVAVYKSGSEGRAQWRQVCFVCGPPADAGALVEHAFGKKEAVKTGWSIAYVPTGSGLIKELRRRGLRRAHTLLVFERRTAKG